MPDPGTESILEGAARLGLALRDLVWPPACLLCRIAISPGDDLCPSCLRALPGLRALRCRRCGRTAGGASPGPCLRCREESHPHDGVIAAASYEGPVRDLVHRLKFRGERTLARPLAGWLAEAVRRRGPSPDRIAGIPLHWRRRWWRGFDQAGLLARHLARDLGVPDEGQRLVRLRSTPPQSLRGGASARAANVAGAFALRPGPVARGTWLLVDDVLSTGATAGECARLLRGAGAARVVVAVVAR